MTQLDSESPVVTSEVNTDDSIACSLESLLNLGLQPDSKLDARIRPLARELLIQLDPQDAGERMLAVQMVAAFSRSIYLSRNANRQKHPRWFKLYSVECHQAMTLFRRQMQTFADLRRPRRTVFNAIRQANIASQQIVVNDRHAEPAINNPEPTAVHVKPIQKTPPALPSQRERASRPAKNRRKKPALGT